MRYYKVQCYPSIGFEYYAVEASDKPFWWYHNVKREWRFTSTDGISYGQIWEDWERGMKQWQSPVLEVSELEVLVICGSIKE